MSLYLNLASGQRPFAPPFINIDCQSVEGRTPDVQCDIRKLPYENQSAAMAVIHHGLEHFHLTDGASVLQEAYRVLQPHGSLLIFVPDLKSLARRWLAGQLNDYIFFVNCMGAYMGDEADIHRWHYTFESLTEALKAVGKWREIKPFDWREIPSANIARDFWILGVEAVK